MRALTPLMLPTSLQPPLTGPRDVAHVAVHRIADDDDAPPAGSATRPPSTIPPAPAVHFTPRPGVQIHAAPAPKGKRMRNSPNQDAVLAAIQKKSPITRDALMKTTGLDEQQLAQTVWALKKEPARIAVGGTTRNRLYGVPGTKFADRPTKAKPAKPSTAGKRTNAKRKAERAAESFADGVKEIEHEQASTGTNGTSLATTRNATLAPHQGIPGYFDERILEATSLPPRAIRKADGGAIVLRGNTLTAELSAEEVNVIHQLRG